MVLVEIFHLVQNYNTVIVMSGVKRKLSRKEERREQRNQKKAKKHSFFSNKSGKKVFLTD